MGDALHRLRAAGYGYDDDTAALSAQNEDMVALASLLSRVKSYKRRSKTGKMVDVEAYTRTLSKMSLGDLADELENTRGNRTRHAQVANELRHRNNDAVLKDYGNAMRAKGSGTGGQDRIIRSEASSSDAVQRAIIEKNLRKSGGEDHTAADKAVLKGYYDKVRDHHKRTRMDDFGKAVLKQHSDEDLQRLIDARTRQNAARDFGMSGHADLQMMKAEQQARGPRETPEQQAQREADNRRRVAEFNAQSPRDQWEGLHQAQRQSIERQIAKEIHNDSWDLGDEDTNAHVDAMRALYKRMQMSGNELTAEDYKHLMGRVRAADD